MEHCTEDEKTMVRLCAENASLRKQRAELLEALKDMVGCMEQENPLSYAENIRNAREAITRAEAAA